ncbi:DNA topoisomerase I [Candidatus Marsarchaeota archaeon]|nr:DNA topoisomerase I [Candidatus Marsarchaeota archaeon]
MNKLIVAEKPSVALRIAMALGDSNPRSEALNGVRYFVVEKGGDRIFIAAAAGHLFTLTQTVQNKLPVFDIEWIPSYKVSTNSYFTKKYLDALEFIGKQCTFFINACDYDIEGTVIGTNIIKQIVNRDVNAGLTSQNVKRMRFSTTTNADLMASFNNLNEFDRSNFDAGETRHRIDWMWGINLSRALMRAIYSKGIKKTLSIGRVQGPALAILAVRENEIKKFVSRPYWKMSITAKGVEFEAAKGKEIFEKASADKSLEKARSCQIKVKSVDVEERSMRPFPPFDLTSLQLEASRLFHIDPSRTLAIAQALYERSYISYPRTSSQKLPPALNLPRIITSLSKVMAYSEDAVKLIKASRFKPAEGAKDDEAHPAIHPTGEDARKLSEEEGKIYDLITRRFLACFGEYSKSERRRVILDVAGDEYKAEGELNTYKGWIGIYQYYKPKEMQIPEFGTGEVVVPERIGLKSMKTLPPKRYTKAGLIALLEGRDLGTKATRSEIIDTLFKRDYIKGSSIEVTEFGLSIFDALSRYCPDILDENLTRKLENDMEKIQKGEATKSDVIGEGKAIITKLVSQFSGRESEVGDALMKGLKESQSSSIMGTCIKDGGNLVLRRSRTGKSFIGCANWPNCTNTYSVPQGARIVPTGKVCDICHTPKIKVFRKGKRVFEMDLDPNCETKKDWAKTAEQKAQQQHPWPEAAKPMSAVPAIKHASSRLAITFPDAVSKESAPASVEAQELGTQKKKSREKAARKRSTKKTNEEKTVE